MKKVYLLATLLVVLGCSHVQKEAQQDQETPTIVFYSLEDNYMGFYEITSDSLAILIQDSESYHYYVYDSTELIAQGDNDCICRYESTEQWLRCFIEVFVDHPKISSVQLFISNDEDVINLYGCSVKDMLDHEYWASSEDKRIAELLPTVIPFLDSISPTKKESKIVFYSTGSSQNKIEFCPDTITNLLVRCVNRMEKDNPHVVLNEEECRYSVSFFPMEDSISQVKFLFSSNPDGTDITMRECSVTKDNEEEFSCGNIKELLDCTSFIVYPELDGPLMKNFVPKNE